jgi:hypothetical protein
LAYSILFGLARGDWGAAARAVCHGGSSDKVAARVRELTEEAAAMAKLNKSWILIALIENAELALGRRALTVVDKGRRRSGEDGEEDRRLKIVERDATAANRALELLGRELGMFVDRRQEVRDELDVLTHEQRASLIAAMRAALEARQAAQV